MKQFVLGLIVILVLGVAGFFAFRGAMVLTSRFMPSPTPSASPSPISSPSPSPSPSTKATYIPPEATYTPKIIKSGSVKGVSTSRTITTTTTTTSHLKITLVNTSACPASYTTEIKNISGSLDFKYWVKDGYSFGITAWNSNNEEVIQNTTYSSGSGDIKTISGLTYLKVRIETKDCSSTSDNWLTVTAER